MDEGEVVRWIEEGRPYRWIIDEYTRKYGVETTQSMWANFRARRGLTPRLQRDDELIPWAVKREHRWKNPVVMLRAEARRRSGLPQSEVQQARLMSWLHWLSEDGMVVMYEPDTEEGFFYVPREDGDDDLIRRPERATRERLPNRVSKHL